MEDVVVSKKLRGVLFTNLLAERCDRCGELIFTRSELERVKAVLARREQMRQKAA